MSAVRAHWSRIGAFLRRDALTQVSYKLGFATELATLASSVLTVYFLSRMLDGGDIEALGAYNGAYFGFAVVGLAMADYMSVGLRGFVAAVRRAMVLGHLEAMLATPTPAWVLVFGSAAYSFVWTLLRTVVLLAAALALGADFGGARIDVALVATVLTMLAAASLGLLGVSITLIAKRGEPFTALVAGLSVLLGGVLYPVESLPAWAQSISQVLPATHSIHAVREALLSGAGWGVVATDLVNLIVVIAVVAPVGLWAVGRAVRSVRKEGSASHY